MPGTFMTAALLQIGVPLALLAWQATRRDRNLVLWCLMQTAVWGYIYATTIAGIWLFAPWYVPQALMIISVGLAVRSLPGAFTLWQSPRTVRGWAGFSARASAAALVLGVLYAAVQGRTLPDGTVIDLASPLRSGHYYIANGGSTQLVNAHVEMRIGDRFRRYRGSSYGVDIVALNSAGVRANAPRPQDPTRYAIFGDPIYAPCEGVVIRVEDWLPDLQPPQVDRAHMPGNFVLLECGDNGEFHVLLAHMREHSVRVHPGDYVTTSTRLGEVGNSGSSDEPHLHIHAQRPGRIWDLFSGDPLPIRIDGRYLVRNDRFSLFVPDEDIIDD